jgi:hypothetical protein
MPYPRDHYPTTATATVLEKFNAIIDEEMTGKSVVSASSGDVSGTKQVEGSMYSVKVKLWETLSSRDAVTYPWPPPFLRVTQTVGVFRHRDPQ